MIAANKNSPKMTVIAGETAPVKAAMATFEAEGFSCVALATSHAFHSRIVAPANEPLRLGALRVDGAAQPDGALRVDRVVVVLERPPPSPPTPTDVLHAGRMLESGAVALMGGDALRGGRFVAPLAAGADYSPSPSPSPDPGSSRRSQQAQTAHGRRRTRERRRCNC